MKTLLLMSCLLFACWTGPEVGEEQVQMLSPDGGRLMTFQELMTEVLVPTCAGSFCHKPDPPPAAPMSLEPAVAYRELVNAPSDQRPGMMRIAPNDPANSWVLVKLKADLATAAGTTRMPLNKPELSPALVEQLENWINRGAPND